jgi:hypothetical protein
MNRFSKIILITSIAVIGAGIFAVPETSAQPANLDIQFEQTPLFNETNILPGDTVSRWVKATNNSGYNMPIATQAINVSDPDNLGSKLSLVIKEGTDVLYTGTLADFLAAGEVYLSNLAGDGSQTQYDFTVDFDPLTDNPYQEKRVGFDIQIGFQGDLPTPPAGQTYGTMGGGAGGNSLLIYDETILDRGDDFATITWKTKVALTDFPYAASSQVIYSAAGESHVLDLNDNMGTPPLYGYAHTTPETDTAPKVVDHSVTITGLTPGTTYFFRCVSRGSLAISAELTFTTTGVAGVTTGQGGAFTSVPSTEEEIPPEGIGGTPSGEYEIPQISPEVKGLMAAVGDLFKLGNFCWLLLVIIIILLILYLLSIAKMSGEKKKKWLLPLIIAVLIVLYCIFCCESCGSIFCCKTCWILIIIDIILYLISLFIGGKKE